MSEYQRNILKDYYNEPAQYYHATFDHITHKINKYGKKSAVALLLDLYLVDKNDHRIAIKRDSPFKDAQGYILLADHVWVDFLYPWYKLPHELFYGDQIKLKAEVEEYPIARDSLVNARNKIWSKVKAQNDEIHANWQATRRNYHGQEYKAAYERMRATIKQNTAQAKILQEQIPLVDYSLNRITNIEVTSYADRHIPRVRYEYFQFKKNGYKYTAWLAARSMKYKSIRAK